MFLQVQFPVLFIFNTLFSYSIFRINKHEIFVTRKLAGLNEREINHDLILSLALYSFGRYSITHLIVSASHSEASLDRNIGKSGAHFSRDIFLNQKDHSMFNHCAETLATLIWNILIFGLDPKIFPACSTMHSIFLMYPNSTMLQNGGRTNSPSPKYPKSKITKIETAIPIK